LLGNVDRAGVSSGCAKYDESPQSMRRKPGSTSASRIIGANLRHPSADGSRMLGDVQHGPDKAAYDRLEVVDDYPEIVPVTQRELEVIETYLGSLLDDMLKRTR